MGLIHTRARKQRDRAEAEVLREQAAELRKDRQEQEELDAQGRPLWRQPTVGALLSEAKRRRQQS